MTAEQIKKTCEYAAWRDFCAGRMTECRSWLRDGLLYGIPGLYLGEWGEYDRTGQMISTYRSEENER